MGGKGQVSARMAPRRPTKDKKQFGHSPLDGPAELQQYCAVHRLDWYVHYWQLRRAGVRRCTDTLVTGQVQRERLRTTPGLGSKL